jgi:hypothetical protein
LDIVGIAKTTNPTLSFCDAHRLPVHHLHLRLAELSVDKVSNVSDSELNGSGVI